MEHPVITIGGQDFVIPPLSIGQLKVVVPAMLRLNTMKEGALTEENISDLSEIAYVAICRARPTFNRSEFTAMEGTVGDLLIAKLVIARQCGMEMKPSTEPGEALAEK